MKKVLPIVIVAGVISLVACAGLGSCGVVAADADVGFNLASPKMAVADDGYSTEDFNLGMFDVVDESTRTIVRRTSYLTLDSSNTWRGAITLNYGVNFSIDYDLSDLYSNTSIYCNCFTLSSTGAYSDINPYYFRASTTRLIFVLEPSTTYDDFFAYIASKGGLHLQYRSTTTSTETFEDAMNGLSNSDAYQDGVEDGVTEANLYDITFSNAVNFGYQMLKVNYDGAETTYYASTDAQTLTFDRRKPLAFTTSAYNNYGITLNLGDNFYVLDTVQDYYLPYFEGDIVISFTNVDTHFATTPLQFYCGEGYLSLTNIGKVYSNGYAAGYTAGYDTGYSAGYTAGFSSATTTDTGVYIQWDTSYSNNYSYSVKWYEGSTQLGSYTLSSYTPTAYFNRPAGKTYTFMIQSDNSTPFSVRYSASGSSVSQTLTDALAVDSVYYLPYWEGSITLTVVPDPSISVEDSFTFSIDPSELGNVKLGSSYVNGYNIGHSEGYDEGKVDGISIGYDDGFDDGYDRGYDEGKAAGIEIGKAAVSDGGLVVSNLFGAIVGVPISILNGLSGLTIWSIPLISVLMSFLFLGLVLWIIRLFV